MIGCGSFLIDDSSMCFADPSGAFPPFISRLFFVGFFFFSIVSLSPLISITDVVLASSCVFVANKVGS